MSLQINDLAHLGGNQNFECDLLIIGGGPAGLTIAREFFDHSTRVLVLESGRLKEEPQFDALNTLESIGEPKSAAQISRRVRFHRTSSGLWSHSSQPYGVRCRALGGSSWAWAGKSAAFDEIDFEYRPWVPYSGWPITRAALGSYIDRAAERLNLGPAIFDDRLWELIGGPAPEPPLDPKVLRSFFWQFARSRVDQMNFVRFGPEFVRENTPNVRVLLNATVTKILTNAECSAIKGVEASSLDGVRAHVQAKAIVLAASGIENPRLLLASNQFYAPGIGNQYDVVGRYLMDHPDARLARFRLGDIPKILRRFGFSGLHHNGRTHMCMHGLTPTRAVLEREEMLNCALFFMEERAPDDPWEALKRLMRRKSTRPLSDLAAVAKCPGMLAKGFGMKALNSDAMPKRLKDFLVNQIIQINPNFVVREFLSRGLPHKLTGLAVEGICEQRPDPASRITLADNKDPLGVRLARVNWKLDPHSVRSLARLGQLMAQEFARAVLPSPILEEWVAEDQFDNAVVIDMAHIMGTTRMSEDPKVGVVDKNCKVHGVAGLYIAGSSVFPTSGHANPTLTIVALAIRLADHLKRELSLLA